MTAAAELVDVIERRRPEVVELAAFAALAVRAEPELLRALRLQLLPHVSAAAEGDLWHCRLVRSRGPDGIVLDHDVAEVLRDRLVSRRGSGTEWPKVEQARAIIERLHGAISPALALEEEVIWLCVSGAGVGRIDRALYKALAPLASGERPGLRDWAASAWARLPRAAQSSHAGAMLRRLETTYREGALALRSTSEGDLEIDLAALLAGSERVQLGVRRRGGVVEFGDVEADGAWAIEVPDTEPRLVEVLWESPQGNQRSTDVAVTRGVLQTIEVGEGTVRLRNVVGEVYELPAVETPPKPEPSEPVPPATGSLDLSNIQGDILRGYGTSFDYASYRFLHVQPSPDAARMWLQRIVDRVTTAARWAEVPLWTLNIALTSSGLSAFGVPRAMLSGFASSFHDGIRDPAGRQLSSVREIEPSGWDRGLGSGEAHVLLTTKAQTMEDFESARGWVEEGLSLAGIAVLHQQDAALLPAAIEHFGYADAASQPAIEGVSDERARGGGTPRGKRWRAVAPGEFIHGYPTEETRENPARTPRDVPPPPFDRDGTYMVWLKLSQDVAAYRRAMLEQASMYADGDEEKLAAKVAGRWPNGTPLATHPDRPDPSFVPDAYGANDFRYERDPRGERCPLDAHIRQMNPRDERSARQRMIRRGMAYGPALPSGQLEDDGADRGLVFVAYVASLARQFERIQTQALGEGFLTGSLRGRSMTVPGRKPLHMSAEEAFVTVRGGEYLFVPSMSALRALAAGLEPDVA